MLQSDHPEYAHEVHHKEEDYLDECVFAYNTAVHESSKYTPFELMFGRKAVIP